MKERFQRLIGRSGDGEKLMRATATDVSFGPIGVVLNGVHDPRRDRWDNVESRIRLRDELAPTVLGLNTYGNVIVLFYLDEVPNERRGTPPQIHPGGDERYPLQGVLATRTQHRPNPIGMTVATLLKVEDATLWVRGLDAVDGTPVLDIKPYIPYYDALADARVPAWVMGEDDS